MNSMSEVVLSQGVNHSVHLNRMDEHFNSRQSVQDSHSVHV